MYESGYYPAGAEYDPDAPWNEREPRMMECPACGGKGYHWHAYDLLKFHDVEVPERTWMVLPDTEEEAEVRCCRYCKGEKEVCEVCDGSGEVEYEPDCDNEAYFDD